jgi:hypothetical protein
MPTNEVTDPITDQEMAFALLLHSGPMTDRQAAEAVGLNPDSAAYIKSKPCVRAYMLQHRAAGQQQLVQQEADGLRRLHPDREQVLNRLWEIANLSPEMTRNSMTGQVKALSLIIAMQNFIPDRRALSAQKEPAPPPAPGQIYQSAWLREMLATNNDPLPTPDQQEETPEVPEAGPAPRSLAEAPPNPVPSQPAFAHRVPLADGLPPYVPQSAFVPDTRVPHSSKVNPFKFRR